jgi:hypothetical protein
MGSVGGGGEYDHELEEELNGEMDVVHSVAFHF